LSNKTKQKSTTLLRLLRPINTIPKLKKSVTQNSTVNTTQCITTLGNGNIVLESN